MNQIIKKLAHPLVQAVVILSLYLASTFVIKWMDTDKNMPWTLAIAYQLLFIVYTVIIGLVNKPMTYYWVYSVVGFVLLMFINSYLAGIFSGLEIDEAGSYRWIYFVFVPVFLLFIGMATLIKKIVSMAEKDDQRFDNK